MADFTKTITNALRLFGPGNSTKWGQANGYPFTMTWGTSKWGEDGTLVTQFQKVIENSQSLAWAHTQRMDFLRTQAIGSVSPAFATTSQALFNGPGWNYVFTSDSEAGSGRDFASWSAESRPDATFTCAAAGSTTWSSA